MSDLATRLRAFAGNPMASAEIDVLGLTLLEAAEQIEKERAERAELVEALRDATNIAILLRSAMLHNDLARAIDLDVIDKRIGADVVVLEKIGG